VTKQIEAVRFKFNEEENVQWSNDIGLLRRKLGQMPYKYLVLAAVHRWAEEIRKEKASE